MTDDRQTQKLWVRTGHRPWQLAPKWRRLSRSTLDFWVPKGETFLDQWVVLTMATKQIEPWAFRLVGAVENQV
jgi:hypothetical protein